MNTHTPKIGLALGSGGAKGLAHIGVIKSLVKNNIPIDSIAGSSIGALIGAYYAAHKDVKKLEEFAYSFNRRKGFNLFDLALRGGILKGNKLETLIEEMLEGATFPRLYIPFTAVATDFTTAEPIIMTKGNLSKAIRASVSVPGFFKPLELKGKVLADGGLSSPVPVDILRSQQMELIIAVNLDALYINETASVPSLARTPLHSVDILRHHLALHTTKTADVIITPILPYQIGLIGWNYFFDTEKTKSIIDSGERAADEVMPEIKKIMRSWARQKNEKEREVKEERSHLAKIFSFFKRR